MDAASDSTTKQCYVCKQFKPRTREYFSPRPKNSDGLDGRCKECERKRRRKERAEHPERHKASQKRYRENNREWWIERTRKWREDNADMVRAYTRRYYVTNRDRNIAYSRDYYWKHRDRYLINMKAWRINNLERDKARHDRRRARLLSAKGSYTADDVRLQFKSQKGLCWWCGKPLETRGWHIDHRIPLARGGSNDANNLVIAHQHCNQSKKDKMPWEWNGRLL